MPILCSTKRTCDVSLRSDKDLPDDVRPVFTLRALSCEASKEVTVAFDSVPVGNINGADVIDGEIAILRGLLTGWKNVTDPETGEVLPFDADAIGRVLVRPEVHELVAKACWPVGDDDKKKSASRL